MKKVIVLLMTAMMLGSCATLRTYSFVQVIKTKSADLSMTEVGGGTRFEDDMCFIIYQPWSEGGHLSYTIHNKTDQILYLDLDKSFFIKNGIAQDYFIDRVVTNSASDITSVGRSAEGLYAVYSSTSTSSSMFSESIQERSVLAIPPKASKVVSMFTIMSDLFLDCDLNRYPSDSSSIAFNAENSPIHFSNYLTYRLGSDSQERTIENRFYISRITNYAQPTFIRFVRRDLKPCQNMTDEVDDNYKLEYSVEVYDLVYNVDISNCFYNRYQTKSGKAIYEDKHPKNLHYDKQYNGYIREQPSEHNQYIQRLTHPFAKPE